MILFSGLPLHIAVQPDGDGTATRILTLDVCRASGSVFHESPDITCLNEIQIDLTAFISEFPLNEALNTVCIPLHARRIEHPPRFLTSFLQA